MAEFKSSPMEEEEEIHDFRARLKTLQHVAIEITSVLEDQNKKLEENDTVLQKSVRKISHSLKKMSRIGGKRFNVGMYLVLSTLLFVVLFYILFIIL